MINRRLTHFVTTLFRTKPVQCTQALHDNSISFTPLKTHGLSAYPAVKKNVMYFFTFLIESSFYPQLDLTFNRENVQIMRSTTLISPEHPSSCHVSEDYFLYFN